MNHPCLLTRHFHQNRTVIVNEIEREIEIENCHRQEDMVTTMTENEVMIATTTAHRLLDQAHHQIMTDSVADPLDQIDHQAGAHLLAHPDMPHPDETLHE